MPVNTTTLQLHRFQPGVSGNLKGRPKGSKNKLSEIFLAALAGDLNEYGTATIEKMLMSDPSDYIRTCAAIIQRFYLGAKSRNGRSR